MDRRIIHDKDNNTLVYTSEEDIDLDIGSMTREDFDHLDPVWIVHRDLGLAHRIGVKTRVGKYAGRPVDLHFHFYRALGFGRELTAEDSKRVEELMTDIATNYTRILVAHNPLVVVRSMLCPDMPEFLARGLDQNLGFLADYGPGD